MKIWTRIRETRRITKLVVLLFLIFVGLTARLFVWPDVNAPVHADAIVILGGGGGRIAEGDKLAREGYAPLLVYSIYSTQHCIPSTPKTEVRCFVANPSSTRGEARAIAHLAHQLRLHRIILVVNTPQATRARLRVGRCYAGHILVVGVSPGDIFDWSHELLYEWFALAKAVVLQPTC